MKKISLVFFYIILALACNARKPLDLRAMTFNIRLDAASDKMNNWKYRKDNVALMVRFYSPDILGTQEVLHNQLVDLKQRLPEYTALGVGRNDGKEEGEYSAIFYKTDRFKLIDYGNFSISETPEIIGVKGWDAACERIATWAIFKDKKTRKKFFYLNTHLDHVGKVAKREGSKLVLKHAQELAKGLPIIITGDFNEGRKSDVFKAMTEDGIVEDSRLIADVVYGPDWSYHAFGHSPLERRTLIDYIFVSKDITVLKHSTIDDRTDNGNGFLSDHSPVMADISIK